MASNFVLQITFFSLKLAVTVFVSSSMFNIDIHLRKPVDNVCYFHEKQP